MKLKAWGALLAVVLSLALATGCGDSEDQGSGAGSSQVVGCLTPSEVSAEVNAIAEGAEGSSEEAEQKQEAIAAVEAEAC
jgi:hypothetical protein